MSEPGLIVICVIAALALAADWWFNLRERK